MLKDLGIDIITVRIENKKAMKEKYGWKYNEKLDNDPTECDMDDY